MFKDNNGNLSSKRIIGAVVISLAIILGTVLFFMSIWLEVKDPSTAMNLIITFMTAGGTLLGIGTFETLKKKGSIK